MLNNTTRRYPRTEAEAFRGADYANAFWKAAPQQQERWSWKLAIGIAIAIAFASLLLQKN